MVFPMDLPGAQKASRMRRGEVLDKKTEGLASAEAPPAEASNPATCVETFSFRNNVFP